jgi:hypothetical protein
MLCNKERVLAFLPGNICGDSDFFGMEKISDNDHPDIEFHTAPRT